jgi:hypothetical protein
MSSSKKVAVSVDAGWIALVLTLVLMWAKVEGHFEYHWIWVFAPFWAFPVVMLALIAAMLVIGAVAFVFVVIWEAVSEWIES